MFSNETGECSFGFPKGSGDYNFTRRTFQELFGRQFREDFGEAHGKSKRVSSLCSYRRFLVTSARRFHNSFYVYRHSSFSPATGDPAGTDIYTTGRVSSIEEGKPNSGSTTGRAPSIEGGIPNSQDTLAYKTPWSYSEEPYESPALPSPVFSIIRNGVHRHPHPPYSSTSCRPRCGKNGLRSRVPVQ